MDARKMTRPRPVMVVGSFHSALRTAMSLVAWRVILITSLTPSFAQSGLERAPSRCSVGWAVHTVQRYPIPLARNGSD